MIESQNERVPDESNDKDLSPNIRNQLNLLMKKKSLLPRDWMFKGCVPPKEGDIFVIRVQDDCLLYGRVVREKPDLFDDFSKIKPTAVVLITRKSCHEPKMPDEPLSLDETVIPPLLVADYFFLSGYAKTVGNIPLSDEEKKMDIGFMKGFLGRILKYELVEGDSGDVRHLRPAGLPSMTVQDTREYFDMLGNRLDRIPEKCGRLEVQGLGISYEVARELIIDPSILGHEYRFPEEKKPQKIPKPSSNREIPQIEEIVSLMKVFHRESGDLDRRMTSTIKAFRDASLFFLEGTEKGGSKEDLLAVIKAYVLRLGALNDSVDGTLIETDERESIMAFIFSSAENAGYPLGHDVTEEYREW